MSEPKVMDGKMLDGNRLDRTGAAASLVCAAHCAAMPLLAGLLPLLGLSFVASEGFEWVMICLSLSIGAVSLLPSFARRHRQWRPLLMFALGASLMLAVRLWLEEDSRWETPVVVVGALLIATAHWVNLRLCRACAVCHPAQAATE